MKSRFLTFTATRDGVVRHSFSEFPVSPKIEEAIRTDERRKTARKAQKAREYEPCPIKALFLEAIARLSARGVKINFRSVRRWIFAEPDHILVPLASELGLAFQPGRIVESEKKIFFRLNGREKHRSFKAISNLIAEFKNKSLHASTGEIQCGSD